MWLYGVLFALALVQCYALTGLALVIGRRLRILDYPDKERKLHARATPRTGGLAVYGALALGAIEFLAFGFFSGSLDLEAIRFTGCLLLSAALLCGLGLWDDKWGMKARAKFLWQTVAILPFVCIGRSASTAHIFGWQLDFTVLAIPLTLFWLVSCTNFVNLTDGLDGLASTVGLIISLTVAALAGWNQLTDICWLALVVSGALVGFLLHNWPPARIFLGDCGSLPLGFLVGALALEASAKKAAGLTLAVPFVLLTVPMFDTSIAILRRKLNGKKIGQGDRAHIHHCLRDRGLSATQTLLAIGGMCSATAASALAATVLNNDLIAVGTCLGLVAILIAGRLFGFNEVVLLARHIQAAWNFIRWAPRALRARFVVIRLGPSVAEGRLDLWQKIIARANRLHGLELDFVCRHLPSGREVAGLTWVADTQPAEDCATWQVAYAVPRGEGLSAEARARGIMIPGDNATRLNELSELLVALCDNWPVTGALAPFAPAEVRASPRGEPLILSPHWPQQPAAVPALPACDVVGSDAA